MTRAVHRSQWFELLDTFEEGDPRSSAATLEAMMKSARSIGVRRLTDYSRAAVHVARRLEGSGRMAGASLAYTAAVRLDETSFDASAARLGFFSRHRRFGEVLAAIPPAATSLFSSSESRLSLLSSAALVVLGALVAAAVGAILALFLRHLRRLWHDLKETATRFFGQLVGAPVGFVLLALPLFLTLGPVWLLLYWGALAYAYSGRGERRIIALSLLLLGLVPIAIEAVARENLLRRSPLYLAAVDLAERRQDSSVEDGLASLAAAYPDQPDAWFLLARYAERAGDNARAVAAYGRAIQADPADYRSCVNRGNVRFLEGDYAQAINDYEEAARRAPGSAEAFYNLSVARSEIYDFKGQEAARARALQISRRDVDAWSSSPPLTRVVPASYRVATARERARAWNARDGGPLSAGGRSAAIEIALSPLSLAPWGALVVAVIFGAIRSRMGLASECSRCGRAFCRRCKRYGGPVQFCARCARIYTRKEELEEDAREEDRRAIQRRAGWRRTVVALGSTILPGLDRFFAGRPAAAVGMLFLFFLALILVFGGPWLFDLAPLAPARASLPGRLIAGAAALSVWIAAMTGAWRRRES